MTIFDLESFVTGEELTVVMKPGLATTVFGRIAVTYQVVPGEEEEGCRLVSALRTEDARGPFGHVRRRLLAWGDLLMMRKQLRTIAALAREDAAPR